MSSVGQLLLRLSLAVLVVVVVVPTQFSQELVAMFQPLHHHKETMVETPTAQLVVAVVVVLGLSAAMA